MIPGPVNGHLPVDPGLAQRSLTEPASESGAEPGTSFADLLAAMLAPGVPGVQLEAPVAEEAVFERLDAAEMFNETGLFRGAAPLPAPAAIPAGIAADLAVAASVPPAPLAATATAGPKAGLQPPAAAVDAAEPAAPFVGTALAEVRPAAAPAAPAANVAKGAQGAAPLLHGQPAPPSAGAAWEAPAEPAPMAGGGRISSRTAAIVAELLAARSGAAAAQVSVQVVEGGISVLARVDRLSREERDRLRGEIGELLARHGFGNAEIMLNGEAWPLPQGEKE